MKKIGLTIALAALAFTGWSQANTNNPQVTVQVYLTDQQVEDLKLFKRILGETNATLKQFAQTNMTVTLNPIVSDSCATRRQSVKDAVQAASDDLLNRIGALIGLW